MDIVVDFRLVVSLLIQYIPLTHIIYLDIFLSIIKSNQNKYKYSPSLRLIIGKTSVSSPSLLSPYL